MKKLQLPESLQNLPDPKYMSTIEIEDELQYFEENLENKSSGELENYPGLGIMDTGVKEWLEDSGTITEGENGFYKVDYVQFYEFQRNMKLLDIVKRRKAFAEKNREKRKEQEEFF